MEILGSEVVKVTKLVMGKGWFIRRKNGESCNDFSSKKKKNPNFSLVLF